MNIMVKVILPDSEDQTPLDNSVKIFLAGTIEMGNSINWQKTVEDYYKRSNMDIDVTLFNPRRICSPESDEIEYQINWELEHLESADSILMNIIGTSKSPITLLELGLFARSGKLTVICEENFYRYDNIRITCKKYNIPLRNSLNEYLFGIK